MYLLIKLRRMCESLEYILKKVSAYKTFSRGLKKLKFSTFSREID